MNDKIHILNLDGDTLNSRLAHLQLPKFRFKQILEWIYHKKILNPNDMSNVPKNIRDELLLHLDFSLPEVFERVDSADGASKLLLKFPQTGQVVETVLMRYENRVSVCVSSQVGCKLSCSFCQTGKLGFFRHLKSHEILAQFFAAELIAQSENRKVTHVVFMGMGEPFDNYDEVMPAVNKMTSPDYFGLTPRNVTVSTSGIAPRIKTFARESKASLALSLHAANEELRTSLMPITRKYDLADLKEALVDYQAVRDEKVTLEYILIQNINDDIKHAKDLVKFIHGLRAKVNLIAFNAHPGLPYERPTEERIRAFQKYLSERSIPAPVRYSLGQDISGACGQLAAKVKDHALDLPSRKEYAALSSPN